MRYRAGRRHAATQVRSRAMVSNTHSANSRPVAPRCRRRDGGRRRRRRPRAEDSPSNQSESSWVCRACHRHAWCAGWDRHRLRVDRFRQGIERGTRAEMHATMVPALASWCSNTVCSPTTAKGSSSNSSKARFACGMAIDTHPGQSIWNACRKMTCPRSPSRDSGADVFSHVAVSQSGAGCSSISVSIQNVQTTTLNHRAFTAFNWFGCDGIRLSRASLADAAGRQAVGLVAVARAQAPVSLRPGCSGSSGGVARRFFPSVTLLPGRRCGRHCRERFRVIATSSPAKVLARISHQAACRRQKALGFH